MSGGTLETLGDRELLEAVGEPLAGGLWFAVAIAGLTAGEWPGLVVSNLWLVATFVPLGLLLSVRAGTVDAAGEPRPGANVGRASLRSEPHPTG